jgi:uncharacterized coiled-coil DUF342 family protein
MDSQIDNHLMKFLIHQFSSYNFGSKKYEISFRTYWRSDTHYVSRNTDIHGYNYIDDESYNRLLEQIFSKRTISQIIDALNDSEFDMDFIISINQYLTSYALFKYVSNLTSFNEISDKINNIDDSLTAIKDDISKINDINDEIQQIKDNINISDNRIIDMNHDINLLKDKIDTLDDKFNLLSSFIDLCKK